MVLSASLMSASRADVSKYLSSDLGNGLEQIYLIRLVPLQLSHYMECATETRHPRAH